MTSTDDPDTWHPGAVVEPGRPCPPHHRAVIEAAITAAKEAHAERERLIRQRKETK